MNKICIQPKFRSKITWTVRAALLYLIILVVVSTIILYSMIPFKREEDNGLIKDHRGQWTHKSSELVTCKIPYLDPFDKTIGKIRTPPENWMVTCGSSKVFSINKNRRLIQHTRQSVLDCCYREMKPNPKPNPASYSPTFSYSHIDPTLIPWYSRNCTKITSNVTKIPANFEFISIECILKDGRSNLKNTTIIYRDMFPFIPKKMPKTSLRPEIKPPSILLIGFEQISHMQFIRDFPWTFEFLTKKLSPKQMFGYNKVDQTSLPNVAAMLTGSTLEELSQSCWHHSFLSFFDTCPFIWKNFSKNGYLTSYAEDKMPYSTFFNRLYARRGFREQPTDYFYNFLGMQAHQMLKSRPMCIKNRLAFQNMLDYVKNTAEALKTPYFQFVWASSLTKYYSFSKNGDPPLVSTLQYLQDEGFLNNTILFLVSDQGYRFSPLIELRQGRFESKMPLFLTLFPKSFSQRYSTAVSNFENNSYRLTTPFDLFETLKDLTNPEKYLSEESVLTRKISFKSRGSSLFLPIPLNRTCEAAGIDANHCVCRDSRPLKYFETSEIVKKFSEKIISEMNNFLPTNSCLELKLNHRFRSSISVVVPENANIHIFMNNKPFLLLKENIPGHFPDSIRPRLKEVVTNGGNFTEVLVTVQTIPGMGIFEGRLKLVRSRWIVQDVLRLNEYSLQSHCVSSYKLKPFCYCREQIVA